MSIDPIDLNKAVNAVKSGMNLSKAVALFNVNEEELRELLFQNNISPQEDTFQMLSDTSDLNYNYVSEKVKNLKFLDIRLMRLESQLKQIDVAPYTSEKLERIEALRSEIKTIQKQIYDIQKNIIASTNSEKLADDAISNDINYEETPKSEYKNVTNGLYDGDYVQINGVKHFRYEDANPEDLVNIGHIKVQKELAENFNRMQADAKKDGVNLFVVSGTRTTNYQVSVFKRKFKDKENPTEEELYSRIKWSAPSGYSEHHTGYAVDLNSTSTNFSTTREYEWLLKNAHKYGFEQSYPKNNKQNVGFEPWHWRYIGNDDAKKIFELAREYSKESL